MAKEKGRIPKWNTALPLASPTRGAVTDEMLIGEAE
jgi:hypothetical protein